MKFSMNYQLAISNETTSVPNPSITSAERLVGDAR